MRSYWVTLHQCHVCTQCCWREGAVHVEMLQTGQQVSLSVIVHKASLA